MAVPLMIVSEIAKDTLKEMKEKYTHGSFFLLQGIRGLVSHKNQRLRVLR